MKNLFWLIVTAMVLVTSLALASEEAKPATEEKTAEPATTAIDPAAYPLEKCVVSGEKLDAMGKPVVKTYDGREVKFCCNQCVKSFEKDQAKWMKKLDDAIIAEQSKSYPLATCVVSDEKLGSMGDPVNYVYKNQLVKLCCKNCIPAIEKEPAKYLEKISAAQHSTAAPVEEPK